MSTDMRNNPDDFSREKSSSPSSVTTPLLSPSEQSAVTHHEEEETRPTSRRLFVMMHSFLLNLGQGKRILLGWAVLWFLGSSLGITLPKNPDLPSPWYRDISSCIGYTYFLAWSVSFYPQIFYNYRRRETTGLSVDFCGLNVLGFTCYSIYNSCLYWNKSIQELYHERYHDADITVQSNDVAFALHALMLSSLTFCQIGYYNGIRALRPSMLIGLLEVGIILTCLVAATLASLTRFNWLDYIYLLSSIKVFITLIKYLPQLLLNFRRKSTVGWSIVNILLDFSGGVLSVLQLVLDCADMGDWSGITGNLAKFGLGFVSIVFDILFMLQHYVFYPEADIGAESEPPSPLLFQEQEQELPETDPEDPSSSPSTSHYD